MSIAVFLFMHTLLVTNTCYELSTSGCMLDYPNGIATAVIPL
jgi:hypothetical protein